MSDPKLTNDQAKEIVKNNQKLRTSFERLNKATESQSTIAGSIAGAFTDVDNSYNTFGTQVNIFASALEAIATRINEIIPVDAMTTFMNTLEENANRYADTVNTLAASVEGLSSAVDDIASSSNTKSKETSKILKKLSSSVNNGSIKLKNYWKSIKGITKSFRLFSKGTKEVSATAFSVEVGLKGITSGISSFLSFLPGLFKIVTNFIGLMGRFVKLTVSLPLMLTTWAAEIGGSWRNDIIVTLGQAIENTQDLFSETSNIGKGIQNMSRIGKGMFLEFVDYGSDAVKLFGEGAAGIAEMYKETAQTISEMGQYSELFGSAVTQSKESIFFLSRLKRAFGLTANDIAFYAQDAGINLESVTDRIYNAGMIIDKTAKEYNIDMKRLSKNFNELRGDILLFGHMSDEELVNATARMTHLKVSTKDMSAVFSKFSTFEDAANSVALLSQTFGMNLNAMDIIKAKNPGDIIDMFRNSMLDTGKTFEELSRFEKQIMADQTGMSYESLKAMMTYRDIGYTHQEAVDMIKDQSPEVQQQNALKGLNSSINELQRVLNKSNPFKSFFDGLSNNLKVSKELRETFMSLSSGYEGIYKFALNLDTGTVQKIAEPIKIILRIMNDLLISPAFKTGLKDAIGAIGSLTMSVFGVTDTDAIYHILSEKIGEFDSSKQELLKNDLNKISENNDTPESMKKMIKAALEKGGSVSANFLAALKETREKAKSDPKVKSEFNKFMENFQERYSLSSMMIKGKDGVGEQVNSLSQTLSTVLSGNFKNLKTYFNLSGSVMGAIVKGAATIGISLISLIADSIDDIYDYTNGKNDSKRSVLESLFDWEAGDLTKLANSFGTAIGELFKQGGTFGLVGTWVLEQMTLVFAEIVGTFCNLLFFSLKGLFGLSDNNMSAQNIQWAAKEEKEGFKYEDVDSDYAPGTKDFDSDDIDWKKSVAIRMGHEKETLTSSLATLSDDEKVNAKKLIESLTLLQKEQREDTFDKLDQRVLAIIENNQEDLATALTKIDNLRTKEDRSQPLKMLKRAGYSRNQISLASINLEDGEVASPFTVVNEDGSVNTVNGQTGLLHKPGGYFDSEINRTSRVVDEAGELQSSIRGMYTDSNFSRSDNKKQTVEKLKAAIASVNKIKEGVVDQNIQTSVVYTPEMLIALKGKLLECGIGTDIFNPLTCKSDFYVSPDALVSRSGQSGRHGEAPTRDYVQYKRG